MTFWFHQPSFFVFFSCQTVESVYFIPIVSQDMAMGLEKESQLSVVIILTFYHHLRVITSVVLREAVNMPRKVWKAAGEPPEAPLIISSQIQLEELVPIHVWWNGKARIRLILKDHWQGLLVEPLLSHTLGHGKSLYSSVIQQWVS